MLLCKFFDTFYIVLSTDDSIVILARQQLEDVNNSISLKVILFRISKEGEGLFKIIKIYQLSINISSILNTTVELRDKNNRWECWGMCGRERMQSLLKYSLLCR